MPQKGCRKPNVSKALRGRKRPDLSAALKGHTPWNKGKPASPEVSARLRTFAAARCGKPAWNRELSAATNSSVARSATAKIGIRRRDVWRGGRPVALRRYATAHPEKGREMQRRRARMRHNHAEPVDLLGVARRDRWRCGICKRKVKPADLSFDHIIPVSLGGPHVSTNLRVAHRLCNSRRGAGRFPGQLLLVC